VLGLPKCENLLEGQVNGIADRFSCKLFQSFLGGRFRGITAQNLAALCHDPGACPALICEFVDTAGAIGTLSGPWFQPVDHSAAIAADI